MCDKTLFDLSSQDVATWLSAEQKDISFIEIDEDTSKNKTLLLKPSDDKQKDSEGKNSSTAFRMSSIAKSEKSETLDSAAFKENPFSEGCTSTEHGTYNPIPKKGQELGAIPKTSFFKVTQHSTAAINVSKTPEREFGDKQKGDGEIKEFELSLDFLPISKQLNANKSSSFPSDTFGRKSCSRSGMRQSDLDNPRDETNVERELLDQKLRDNVRAHKKAKSCLNSDMERSDSSNPGDEIGVESKYLQQELPKDLRDNTKIENCPSSDMQQSDSNHAGFEVDAELKYLLQEFSKEGKILKEMTSSDMQKPDLNNICDDGEWNLRQEFESIQSAKIIQQQASDPSRIPNREDMQALRRLCIDFLVFKRNGFHQHKSNTSSLNIGFSKMDKALKQGQGISKIIGRVPKIEPSDETELRVENEKLSYLILTSAAVFRRIHDQFALFKQEANEYISLIIETNTGINERLQKALISLSDLATLESEVK